MTVHGRLPSLADDQPCPVYAIFLVLCTRSQRSGRIVHPMDKRHALGLYCGDPETQEAVLAAVERDRVAHGDNAECLRKVDVHFVPWSLVQVMLAARPGDVRSVFEADAYEEGGGGVAGRVRAQVTRVCRAYGWPEGVREWLLGVVACGPGPHRKDTPG